MLKIYTAKTEQDIGTAKKLFFEFNDFLESVMIDYNDCFKGNQYWQDCREHVEGLPGEYGLRGNCILIAEYKDQIAGGVGLLADSDKTGTIAGTTTATIKRLYVRGKFRGLGIGKKLVEAIIKQAGIAGHKTLFLHTNLLLKPALSLYKSLGFKEIKHRKDYPKEIKDIIVQMELKLE